MRGDGHRYKFTARTDPSFDSAIYQIVFPTKKGEWEEHRLPMKDFVPTFRGRVLSGEPPLDPAKVTSVGFLISDNQAGPFQLELAWIRATTLSEREGDRCVNVKFEPPLLRLGEPRLEIRRKGGCEPVR